ncbi:MAG: chemotaxis protein CheB [Planctomycetota bacterium]
MYVVGVGASAGGLDAIERLFDNMPAKTGMAFVIVQHLSPDFKSLMDELLSRHTDMPIRRVEDGMEVEADTVYLIPPKKDMVLSQGRLLLTDQDLGQSVNLPIDVFLRSLAQDASTRAVAVILSGTGSDGSRGIQDVHDAGGLVLVQDPDSADFDGMPRAAASTQVADVVCPPEMMAARIAEFLMAPSDFERGQVTLPEGLNQVGERFEIFRLFRHKFGIDFSLYKAATIDRRIERRMQMTRVRALADYITLLESDSEELEALYRDLLVEVTQFFRDPDAFDRLRQEVIPLIVSSTPAGGEIRVWVPGCATGEEAYSIAMLLHAHITDARLDVSIKVFATDVHRRSLEYASAGVYSAASLENVPTEFRTRYFTANGDLHHVTRQLRQAVIFAPNDITRDPPFTKIDLVSCRNVLIYLEPKVQKRVLSLFHFGLRTGGVLMLGPSETLGDLSVEFETIDRHWRIYRKQRDVRLPMATRMPMTPALSRVVSNREPFVAKGPTHDSGVQLSGAYEELLSKYVPPSLLVNEYYELVHSFGEARELLKQPEGRPTLDVLKLVQGDLRMALSAGLHKATQQRTRVVYGGVRVTQADQDRQYKVVVEPYIKGNNRMFLICLEELELPSMPEPSEERFDASTQSSERITVLEQELTYTRESLQSTVEELETSNEELQSTNEELIASNEELQSTNEELHSVNEELYTVNAEHKQKIDELTQITSDMDNLLKSTQIGTVFLDRELRIRMFTPAISAAFNMLEQDIGRPIDHIAYKLDHPDLLGEVRSVLAGGGSSEREVANGEGETFLQRVRPYRSAEGRINGIVMTFTDVSAVKEVERARESNAELARSNRDLQDFAYAVSHDLQAPLRHIGDACRELVGRLEEIDDDGRALLRQIGDSSGLLTGMIQSLLAYSRISTRGKQFGSVDCGPLLDSVIDDLSAEIIAAGAEVSRGELPTVTGDDGQVRRLLKELITNAIKFRDDRPAKVAVAAAEQDGAWRFSVADNGVGIEGRHQDRVFVIFQRLGFKPDAPGSGVGLALCKRIVERHGGRIWVESIPNEGSTFSFTIPA